MAFPSSATDESPNIKALSASPSIWYRLHVLIFDLKNFTTNSSSRDRLERVIDPSFIGDPYFSPEEAETIKNATLSSISSKIFTETVEEELNTRLNRRNKKRIESSDFRVCAAHDLAPVFGRILGIDLKQMDKDKRSKELVGLKGLDLGGESWGGLARKSFAPRR